MISSTELTLLIKVIGIRRTVVMTRKLTAPELGRKDMSLLFVVAKRGLKIDAADSVQIVSRDATTEKRAP